MDEHSSVYNPIIKDHFTHPRNIGEMANPDGVGEVRNPVCGDTMRLFIKVESDRIVDVTFLTFGCSAAIASSSLATEMIKEKTIEEVLKISDVDIDKALGGLPQAKLHASLLAERAIKAAVADYRRKSG
jgi:nitrogen fixation NifU-like protein